MIRQRDWPAGIMRLHHPSLSGASQGTWLHCMMSTPSNAFLESFNIDLPSTHQTFILKRPFTGEATTTFLVSLSLIKHNDTLLMLQAPPAQTLCQGQLMGSFICCLSANLGHPPSSAMRWDTNAKLHYEKKERKNLFVDGPCRHVCGYLFS